MIGTLQAFALACGLLFVSLYAGFLNGVTALLFGNFLGITERPGRRAGRHRSGVPRGDRSRVPAAPVRVDRPRCRDARGIRASVLSVVFLVVLGVAVAEAAQITGALLVFALLVVPAAAAQIVTARPALSLALAVGFGLAIVWLGLGDRLLLAVPGRILDLRDRTRDVLRCTVIARASTSAVSSRSGCDVIAPLVADATRSGLGDLLSHPFMRNALLAGTAIAAASGLVGYFVVLRSQVFSADALSHVAFAGALARARDRHRPRASACSRRR